MNLTDTSPGATLTVEEDDALGVAVDAANDVPVDFASDVDWLTVTPDADNPLSARVEVADPASVVGQTGTVTATATLPDGTQAQGTEAFTVVAGEVASLKITATPDAPGA